MGEEWKWTNVQPQTRTHTHTHVRKNKTTKKTWCHTKTPTQLPQNSMSTNNEFQKEILPRSLEPQTSPGGEDVLIIRCCVCGLTTMLPRKRSRHSSSRMPKPGAACLTPHCQIVWPNFFFFRWEQGCRGGAAISPFRSSPPRLSLWPRVPRRLFTSFLPFQIFPKCGWILQAVALFTPPLPSASQPFI